MFALLHSRRAWRPPLTAMLVSILTASPVTFAAGTMSGAQVASALSDLREGNRQNAIATLARSGQLRAPLSSAETAAILAGTTQGARAASIAELAQMLKEDRRDKRQRRFWAPRRT